MSCGTGRICNTDFRKINSTRDKFDENGETVKIPRDEFPGREPCLKISLTRGLLI
ncbi:predicted protein [Botrytis cinerea T4]|uniref:Uncharacterized protein n=1 Tax=Botryotinia fuckeliana (strain T4) TaxID=999810 RepID=G2YRQ6_BOTF4|nr:predicted protein [Botrytis cinerea T4]